MQRLSRRPGRGGVAARVAVPRAIAALAAGLLALAAPSPAGAQALQATAAINVNARIIQSLTLRGVNELNFGDIVAPSSSVTRVVDKADPNAGLFEVVGGAGQGVQVTFAAPASLARVDGPGALAVSLSLFAAPTQAGVSGAQRVFPQGTVTLVGGRSYFFLAGSLTVRDAATNPPGTYTGEFELTVSYTTL